MFQTSRPKFLALVFFCVAVSFLGGRPAAGAPVPGEEACGVDRTSAFEALGEEARDWRQTFRTGTREARRAQGGYQCHLALAIVMGPTVYNLMEFIMYWQHLSAHAIELALTEGSPVLIGLSIAILEALPTFLQKKEAIQNLRFEEFPAFIERVEGVFRAFLNEKKEVGAGEGEARQLRRRLDRLLGQMRNVTRAARGIRQAEGVMHTMWKELLILAETYEKSQEGAWEIPTSERATLLKISRTIQREARRYLPPPASE